MFNLLHYLLWVPSLYAIAGLIRKAAFTLRPVSVCYRIAFYYPVQGLALYGVAISNSNTVFNFYDGFALVPPLIMQQVQLYRALEPER